MGDSLIAFCSYECILLEADLLSVRCSKLRLNE
jgi:hypothetical protein